MDNFLEIQRPYLAQGLIRIRHNGKLNYIRTTDVMLLESDTNYTHIHLSSGKKLVSSRNLSLFEYMLKDTQLFIRPNRGQVVNIDYLTNTAIEKSTKELQLTNGKSIRISRRKGKTLSNRS
ncbi:LytTr DNA-binding region [Emticicia oligotrophica DSM 17448]|uniref:LytTr DNA-binding region n=1 Tax=Emticicia oligotrophica (strain DSM 17448 / CIP 109782 / MTCC 6937 / GPTSA100-15) TaxID=929562 RepID=A0ABN4AJE2_EMTOG|nr:LytTR family DNA-binding domain-containing protein [Emticicia oligotrophica]AFK02142.1 LytTr DNA-binding region [Emticicia oligotrophica DSM 17448]